MARVGVAGAGVGTAAEGPHLNLTVVGMTCASCVARIEGALRAHPAVREAHVNLATGRAGVRLATGADPVVAVRAIEAMGYAVPESSTRFTVGGMTCASCVSRVEGALARIPGVLAASVNLATGTATVHHPAGAVADAAFREVVADAGYEFGSMDARSQDEEDEARERGNVRSRRELLISAMLTVPLVATEMGSHLIPAVHDWVALNVGTRTIWVIQAIFAGCILFGPGFRFLRKGFPALLRGRPDMNSLVALGTVAAYGYSLVATFAPGRLPAGTVNVYFEAAALIVLLVLLGRYLEAKAKGRTSEAIRRLVALAPKTARVVRDGREVETEIDDLRVGDIVRVRPGERVAVDGCVVTGTSYVDESMVTGESLPTVKGPGVPVVGGTLNTYGSFDFGVTGVGSDTVLANIVRMVQEAQGSKLPIQAVVDRVTAWFVPTVMAVSAATFALWLVFGPDQAFGMALVNAVAVLIIACPCAMGLATPTSIMVGTGRAAELGVLFRHGDALQTLRGVDIVALDKTGTLTSGRPEVTDLISAPSFEADRLLGLLASLEARSEHPVGAAVVREAESRKIRLHPVDEFMAWPGLGVSGRVDGRLVEAGADRFMARLGYDATSFTVDAARLAGNGKSPLFVAVEGRVVGVLAVSDPIRDGSHGAVLALRALGLKVVVLTGDNRRTARAVAGRLGIEDVVAEVLPEGKLTALKELQRGGRVRVAFVGDGINDAPALAEADVGIAIGTGTDIAVESADVVLMSGDLRGVVNALALSRAVMRNIRQNLFWAFAYNVALVPVAAGALYPLTGTLLSPILAAGAMASSSVFVLANALRLRRFKTTGTAGVGSNATSTSWWMRPRTPASISPAE